MHSFCLMQPPEPVPHRNGALGFHPINNDVPTLVEVLAKAGYYTAAVNKTVHIRVR